MTQQTDLEELLDTRAAAPLVGLRPQTLVGWRCQRRVDQPPYLRVGRRVRYRPSSLRAWCEAREHHPAEKRG